MAEVGNVTDEKTPEVSVPAEESNSNSGTPEEVENNGVDKVDSDAVNKASDVIDSKLEKSIIRQVEYYFSDSNLNRDKFLSGEIAKDKEGWVQFSTLITFKRLAALSTDIDVIINALQKSDDQLVEISEDRKKIRRHPERPIIEQNDERRKEIMTRTIYAKGFPLGVEMADLINFFEPYNKVVNVIMRKYLDKPTKTYKFKGSVFVTFDKKEQAQEFLDKEKVQYEDRELLRKWQEIYIQDKRNEGKSKAKKYKNDKKQEKDDDKFELPKGAVIFFEGANDVVTREMLRESVEGIGNNGWDIAYISYSKGEKEGYIRFREENTASKFVKELEENKLKLKNEVELKVRELTGDEEEEYLKTAIDQMQSRRQQQKHKQKGGRKRQSAINDNHIDKKVKLD